MTPVMEPQLAALALVTDVLDGRGLDYWLFGGWAVDFWVGTVTRAHDDVDLAVWKDDRGSIDAAFEAVGFERVPVDDDVVGAGYRLGPVLLELTFVVSGDADSVWIPFRDGPLLWSAQPLGQQRRSLLGVSCRTIPLALLEAGKGVPREEPADAAKDRADFETLTRPRGT